MNNYQNCRKILKSDWLLAILIPELNKGLWMVLNNWMVHPIAREPLNVFFFTASKKLSIILGTNLDSGPPVVGWVSFLQAEDVISSSVLQYDCIGNAIGGWFCVVIIILIITITKFSNLIGYQLPWFQPELDSLIGQYAPSRARLNGFFFNASKTKFRISCVLI